MFDKLKQKNEIRKLEKVIVDTETKRSRSQSALVSAILEQKEPDEQDVEFFNNYTKVIDEARDKMQKIKDSMLKV